MSLRSFNLCLLGTGIFCFGVMIGVTMPRRQKPAPCLDLPKKTVSTRVIRVPALPLQSGTWVVEREIKGMGQ